MPFFLTIIDLEITTKQDPLNINTPLNTTGLYHTNVVVPSNRPVIGVPTRFANDPKNNAIPI